MFLSLFFMVALFCFAGNCCLADGPSLTGCAASEKKEKSAEVPMCGCEADAKELADNSASEPVAELDDDDDDDFDPAEFLKIAQLLKEGSSQNVEADKKA